jgi:hypothetical protein
VRTESAADALTTPEIVPGAPPGTPVAPPPQPAMNRTVIVANARIGLTACSFLAGDPDARGVTGRYLVRFGSP